MAGHHCDFSPRNDFFYSLEKLQPRHLRHDQIGQDNVGRLFLQQCERRFSVAGFQAREAQALRYGHAEPPDTFLVVHHQKSDFQMFGHRGFPIVCSTTEINCCTLKGFSTQGTPVLCRVAAVSSFAMSPVMKTRREESSGRLRETQAWTSAPSTPPGVRMSETIPRKSPDSSKWRPSAPDSLQTTW